MKIRDLVTVPVTCHGRQKRGIVKISTDEDFVGYGEIGEAATGQLGKIITERWRRIIIGKDPMDTERILREIWAASIFAGRLGGPVLSSYSGVDFALLDLKGKDLGDSLLSSHGWRI